MTSFLIGKALKHLNFANIKKMFLSNNLNPIQCLAINGNLKVAGCEACPF